ncbi:MAG: NADH-ubiquinone oxidoreductase, partial [Gammaproteobacteria bacterium]|nr:NADH-ubiquinone oxidoreductase [Gammaproteobacteria bacterium]
LHLGLYGWLRFLPLGQVTLPYWSFIILGFGLFAMFYGALVGLTQNKAKSLLAYSSISQMGMMLLLLGIGFSAPSKWHVIQTSLLLFALHHALSKGALFYGLSTQGIHKLALVLPALSLAGLPFTSGALAKSALKDQLIFLPELWVSLINWLLPLASIGTTLLMARFLYLCRNSHHSQTPKGLYWWLLLMCSLLIPWYWSLQTINIISIWSGFWPVLAGAVIAYVVYKGSYQSLFSRTPSIPPGDILILGEKVLKQSHLSSKTEHNTHQEESDFILGPQKAPAFIAVPERYLAKWTNAISLFLMVLIGLFLFLTDIL